MFLLTPGFGKSYVMCRTAMELAEEHIVIVVEPEEDSQQCNEDTHFTFAQSYSPSVKGSIVEALRKKTDPLKGIHSVTHKGFMELIK
jgi:superfamily II DNA or RNA helicase